ncbi:MAG: ankyrin repeat domain-containing protein [Chloroflexota bacterium]|nr:ankyrin repeat domain-containing protein [Chloroflexota bacterium]
MELAVKLVAPELTDSLWQDNPGTWGCEPADIWSMLRAALEGDVDRLRALAGREPNLVRAEYWYTQPLHFAVREGHAEAVLALLELGAVATYRRYGHEPLATVARDRGHEDVAEIIEGARTARGLRGGPHAVHAAAAAGEADRLGVLVGDDRSLLNIGDDEGFTPLHRAVKAGQTACVRLLLESGAAPDAIQAGGGGNRPDAWYRPAGRRPIDLALKRNDFDMVGVLLAGGAELTIDVAAAMGDDEEVGRILDSDPEAMRALGDDAGRPMGAAARRGHMGVVRTLLAHGVDPNLREGRDAPHGSAIWHAAQRGDGAMARTLLEAGADPNAGIESSGTAAWMAKEPGLRRMFEEHGGFVDASGHLLDGNDEAVLAMADEDPDGVSTHGCGGIFTMVVSFKRREMLQPLLERGVRVPEVVTGCRTYLWNTPDMTRVLLEHGMNPNLPNWQRVTPLHDICSRGGRGRPDANRHELLDLFLEFGADINAVDEEYRSTPLGWAARNGLADMVELLLVRGANASLAGEPWATPLEWARRRGHAEIEALLQPSGAS